MNKKEIVWDDLINAAPASWWNKIILTIYALLKILHIRVFELDGSKKERRFLHLDLYQLRYVYVWKQKYVDLRYLDPAGRLMVARFKVSEHWGKIHLQETARPPKPGKYTKGPGTFKASTHDGSVLFWLGTVRRKVWSVSYSQII